MEMNKELILKNMNTEMHDILTREGTKEFSVEFSRFVDQICDISLDIVVPLSKRETYVLRKRLGVFDNGKIQSCRMIGESLEDPRSVTLISQVLKKDYRKIGYYINKQIKISTARHYEEQVDSTNLDYQILDTDIIAFDLSVHSFNCLRRVGIETMRDLIRLSTDDLHRLRNMRSKDYEEIINLVHNKGLFFADEVSKVQIYAEEIHKQLDKKVDTELQQKYRSLVSEKAQLEARSKELDLEISTVMEQLKSKNNEAKYGQSKK